jgi:hypothetical protein
MEEKLTTAPITEPGVFSAKDITAYQEQAKKFDSP